MKIILLLPKYIWNLSNRNFILWFIFSVLFGLFGPITNYIINDIDLCDTIVFESTNGTFFTYSIALIASSLGLLIIKIVEDATSQSKEKHKFITIKTVCLTITLILWLFDCIFYAKHSNHLIKSVNKEEYEIQWSQLIFFILAIIIAIYVYCIQFLTTYPNLFSSVSDENYTEQEKKGVEKLLSENKGLRELSGVKL